MGQPKIKTDIEARVQFSNEAFNETLDNVDIPISWQNLEDYKEDSSPTSNSFFGGALIGPGPYSPQMIIGSNSGVKNQKAFIRRFITNTSEWTPWTELFTVNGGTITGNLSIKKDTNPSLYLYNTTTTAQAIFQQLDSETLQILNYYDGNNYNGIYIHKYTNGENIGLRYIHKTDGTATQYTILHQGNVGDYALPISGGTLTGQLKADKNISIINTNPWVLLKDSDTGYNFYLQVSGSLLGLGNGWENSLLINTSGQVTLQTKTSIADNTPAGIFFHITQTDNNITTKSAFIKVYDDHDAQAYGTTMVIQSAGDMIIGSGEAPNACYTTDLVNSAAENTYIVSDNNIYFYTNCNTYANKKTSVYINTSGVLYGAAWNDYAEFRESVIPVQAGRCVKELGNGKLQQTQSRLEPGCLIVSDTFGYAIGQTEICNTPIAVSGRVLAYPYEDRNSYEPGDAVCSGPNGTVSKMTRKEIMFYPERIIGTVSEIPEYDTWGEGNVAVKDRIWISIK